MQLYEISKASNQNFLVYFVLFPGMGEMPKLLATLTMAPREPGRPSCDGSGSWVFIWRVCSRAQSHTPRAFTENTLSKSDAAMSGEAASGP